MSPKGQRHAAVKFPQDSAMRSCFALATGLFLSAAAIAYNRSNMASSASLPEPGWGWDCRFMSTGKLAVLRIDESAGGKLGKSQCSQLLPQGLGCAAFKLR